MSRLAVFEMPTEHNRTEDGNEFPARLFFLKKWMHFKLSRRMTNQKSSVKNRQLLYAKTGNAQMPLLRKNGGTGADNDIVNGGQIN